jgi:hypothetical protein
MPRSKSILFFAAFLVIFSCSKEEEAPTYHFKIISEPGYLAFNKDAWILLHDKDGKVIDEGQLVDGQTSEFALTEENVGITLVRVNTNTENNLPSFQLESFLNVDAAATWTLKNNTAAPFNCDLPLGDLEIIVSDATVGNNLNGSLAKKGSVLLPDFNTSIGTSLRFPPMTMFAGCNTAFLYVMDESRVPYYKVLENLTPGQYAYNLTQLNNFDQVIDINYQETSAAILTVTGFEANRSIYDGGYCTNFNFGDYMKGVTASSIKVGYLDLFPKYVTSFHVSYPDYAMYHVEAGGVPSAISLPETLMATISDKTLEGYSFSVNEAIVFRQVSFGYYPLSSLGESGMSWMINSGPGNDFKNLTMASSAFIAKYPQFKVENLEHEQSFFYKEYQTISEIVSQRFGDGQRPESYKYVYKSFYN